MMMDMMKGNMSMVLPQILLMSWVNQFFYGFLTSTSVCVCVYRFAFSQVTRTLLVVVVLGRFRALRHSLCAQLLNAIPCRIPARRSTSAVPADAQFQGDDTARRRAHGMPLLHFRPPRVRFAACLHTEPRTSVIFFPTQGLACARRTDLLFPAAV